MNIDTIKMKIHCMDEFGIGLGDFTVTDGKLSMTILGRKNFIKNFVKLNEYLTQLFPEDFKISYDLTNLCIVLSYDAKKNQINLDRS